MVRRVAREVIGRLGAWLDERPWLGPVWPALASVAGALLLARPTLPRVLAATVVAAVFIVPAMSVAYWRRLESLDYGDSVARLFLVTKDALGTLAKLLSGYASSGGRDDVMFGKILSQVVGSCILPFDDELRVRSCLFLVSDDGRRMTCVAKAGRDEPPGQFDRGTRRGDRAFALLDGTDPIFVPDLTEGLPDSWSGSGSGYAGFITAPVFTKDGAFGMLTVDTPERGTLTDSAVQYVQLVADLAAVAVAVQGRDFDGESGHTGETH